jgi:hypothetical protein
MYIYNVFFNFYPLWGTWVLYECELLVQMVTCAFLGGEMRYFGSLVICEYTLFVPMASCRPGFVVCALSRSVVGSWSSSYLLFHISKLLHIGILFMVFFRVVSLLLLMCCCTMWMHFIVYKRLIMFVNDQNI